MARILALVIGMGAIFGGAYFMLKGNLGGGTGPDGQHGTPKETIDRWKDKAKEIEKNEQQHADDMAKKYKEAE